MSSEILHYTGFLNNNYQPKKDMQDKTNKKKYFREKDFILFIRNEIIRED